MTLINRNCANVNGAISKNLPKDGIKMEPAIIKKEVKTAKIRYLFLNNPTFMLE